MIRSLKMPAVAIAIFVASSLLHAQFGPPEPQGSGPKLSPPTVFPAPGSYPTTESITLLDDDPQATIHYTLDGSMPTSKSTVYDPKQLLFLGGIYDGNRGLKAGYTIRAVAMAEGHTSSEVANFQFVIDRRDHTTYVSEEILPGVRMIRDSDNDKMFLVKGAKEYALIDSGMGQGALREYVSQFTGGLPIEVIFTHNHGDHIGQADEFARESVELIGEPDLAGLKKLLKDRGIPDDVIAKNVVAAHDGDRVDLGDRSLAIYTAPGHTPGSLVVFDEQTGNLFTGDSFGSNSPTIPDALWMQWSRTPLDRYLAVVKSCRANFRGKVKYMMTGHNDHPLAGEKYLDNLELALQSLMDKGDAVLVPSYRPAGVEQVVIGDRLHDPDWVAININKETYLPAPIEKIAGLTELAIQGARLSPAFTPEVKDYTAAVPAKTSMINITAEPTSTRSQALSVNGEALQPQVARQVKITGRSSLLKIHVTSPDGTQSADYAVAITRR
jgi:glyoxylase-like metal-dependent hydrolase (beta-lactamase superfamily II)